MYTRSQSWTSIHQLKSTITYNFRKLQQKNFNFLPEQILRRWHQCVTVTGDRWWYAQMGNMFLHFSWVYIYSIHSKSCIVLRYFVSSKIRHGIAYLNQNFLSNNVLPSEIFLSQSVRQKLVDEIIYDPKYICYKRQDRIIEERKKKLVRIKNGKNNIGIQL